MESIAFAFDNVAVIRRENSDLRCMMRNIKNHLIKSIAKNRALEARIAELERVVKKEIVTAEIVTSKADPESKMWNQDLSMKNTGLDLGMEMTRQDLGMERIKRYLSADPELPECELLEIRGSKLNVGDDASEQVTYAIA